tara:strand:+ start:980 stop:1855 length:876 start_codon:yes stop_codon:yes gene_type:complete
MAYQVFLTGRDNINYEFITFNDISINKQTPVSPMPLPEEDSDENVLIKVEGNTTTMDISWTILNATSPVGEGAIIWDASLGKWKSTTTNSSMNTFEQIMDLEERFAPKSITDFFEVRIFDTDASAEDKTAGAPKYTKEGLLQGFTFRTDSSSPVNWVGNMQFIEGSVVTTLSANTHEAPKSIDVKSFIGSAGSRTGIQLDFTEFANYTANDRPVTTGAVLRYKPVTGVSFWREKEISFTANTSSPYNYTNKQFTTPDINQTDNTEIRLCLVTLGGRGQWLKGGDNSEIVVS